MNRLFDDVMPLLSAERSGPDRTKSGHGATAGTQVCSVAPRGGVVARIASEDRRESSKWDSGVVPGDGSLKPFEFLGQCGDMQDKIETGVGAKGRCRCRQPRDWQSTTSRRLPVNVATPNSVPSGPLMLNPPAFPRYTHHWHAIQATSQSRDTLASHRNIQQSKNNTNHPTKTRQFRPHRHTIP